MAAAGAALVLDGRPDLGLERGRQLHAGVAALGVLRGLPEDLRLVLPVRLEIAVHPDVPALQHFTHRRYPPVLSPRRSQNQNPSRCTTSPFTTSTGRRKIG